MLQRYRDLKIRVCGKNSIPLWKNGLPLNKWVNALKNEKINYWSINEFLYKKWINSSINEFINAGHRNSKVSPV